MDFEKARDVQRTVGRLSNWKKFLVEEFGMKVYVGRETREGWTGHLPFYVFLCPKCESTSKDYPHGFIERRYLLCHKCGLIIRFIPWWFGFYQFFNFTHFLFFLILSKSKFSSKNNKTV